MGNSRSKAKASNTAVAAVAVAAALDETRSSKNGKQSPSISSKNSNSSKKKEKKGKNHHEKNYLTRQDSYYNAILHHKQQHQQEALHSLPLAATTTSTTAKAATAAAVHVEEIRSMHSGLVRNRDGEQLPVHQIYDIIDEIGHGGLCKVFRIQKKQEYIGGSSRPQHVITSNTSASKSSSSSRWFIKTLQSLGTITIRAPPPPKEGEEEDASSSSYLDPWDSPELRFLYHHHRDSSAATNDDSASSDIQQQEQQQQQQTTTAPPPAAGDVSVTTTNNGSSTCVTATTATTPSSSLVLSSSNADESSNNSTNNNTAGIIPCCNKPMYFALKVINLVLVKEDKIAQLKNEVIFLKTLDHPNILKIYETFNTKRQIMMIMELCTGGDLYARIPYTEIQVADMLRQILSAIRYIHVRHIVHRDIKLENIMFESTHPQAAIKVIDFGLSKNYSTNSHHILTERVGTLYSMSPETMRGIAYTTQADLWSIGVCTFILLANGRVQPFEGKNPKQVVANVLRGRFAFDNDEIWGNISQHAKDFISNLLVLEPEQRLTSSTAREHAWFAYCKKLQECQQLEQEAVAALDAAATADAQKRSATNSTTTAASSAQADASIALAAAAFVANTSTDNEDDGSVVANIGSNIQHAGGFDAEMSFRSIDMDTSKMEEFKNRVCTSLVEYADMGEFRKLALNVIAKKSSSSEIFELRKVFEEFDYLGTGTITLEEFSAALSQFKYSPHDIHKIFTKIDVNRDNAINYTEFLAAALETQGTIEEYQLAEAFDILDVDDSGYISHENLREILPRAKYSDAFIDQLIAEADTDKDGEISYEEFLQVFAKKKHDRIEAIYYGSSNYADTERNVTAAHGGEDNDDDDAEGDDGEMNDSSHSTDDILRRYGILQSLRRGFGSSERLGSRRESNRSRSRVLSSGSMKNGTTRAFFQPP